MFITRGRALVTAALLAATVPNVSGRQEAAPSTQAPAPSASSRLEDLTWIEADRTLTADTIVVIPIGGAAAQHGPHLDMRTDAVLAAHFARRLAALAPIVVAPTVTYAHHPEFAEYPGTLSLSHDTARDALVDAVRGTARFGPRRFYLLTAAPLASGALDAAAALVAKDGILARVTDAEGTLRAASRQLETGSHAGDVETSLMLLIDPSGVEMSKAVREDASASSPLVLTRQPTAAGTFSSSGVWGDPTAASAAKGRLYEEALLMRMVADIAALRTAPLPTAVPSVAPRVPTRAASAGDGTAVLPQQCSAGDERSIRSIGDAFTRHWTNQDPILLAGLWAPNGDILHPDGSVERTPQVIQVNRTELFRRREYRASRHPVQLGVIRCLNHEAAVADGKWELRDVTDAAGKIVPVVRGLCTLVVGRSGAGGWRIEAWRYTIDPAGPPPPTLLKRPGWPGRGGGG